MGPNCVDGICRDRGCLSSGCIGSNCEGGGGGGGGTGRVGVHKRSMLHTVTDLVDRDTTVFWTELS